MSIRATLFPSDSRFFPGQRWVNISLRTLHLIGLAGLGAGYLYPAAGQEWQLYLYLTLFSGIGLMLISIWSNGIWLLQLRGQAIVLKLMLLASIPLLPGLQTPLFITVIIISGLISHATGNVRYYSLFHRRRIEKI